MKLSFLPFYFLYGHTGTNNFNVLINKILIKNNKNYICLFFYNANYSLKFTNLNIFCIFKVYSPNCTGHKFAVSPVRFQVLAVGHRQIIGLFMGATRRRSLKLRSVSRKLGTDEFGSSTWLARPRAQKLSGAA